MIKPTFCGKEVATLLGLNKLLSLINLTNFIDNNPNLKSLLDHINQSEDDFWLVGGCLRNAFLDLPQTDIDIACSADPTNLIQQWANSVGGKWFWLDAQRKQSRVLLPCGLPIDVTMLRAPSINKDILLRDFTINAIAAPLSKDFPAVDIIDPLRGIEALENKQITFCSITSFSDDPLRILKGIRHAVALNFEITPKTFATMALSAPLLKAIAGERILAELSKIFASAGVTRGIELLLGTGILAALFGSQAESCNKDILLGEIETLCEQITNLGSITSTKLPENTIHDPISPPAMFIFARLIKLYKPKNISSLLHDRLRFSRQQERLIAALLKEPDAKLVELASTLAGERQQALLMEKLGPFATEILLNYGVFCCKLTLERLSQLQQSFEATQKHGRIPDLITGKFLTANFKGVPSNQIGKLLQAIKVAEINNEITSFIEAEVWLRAKLY